MTKNFASIAAALAADSKHVRLRAWLGGVPIECFEAHTQHAVDQPIGTCSLVVAAPITGSATNASLVVQSGYPGAVRTIFSGVVPSHEAAIDEQGRIARISAVGWASRLDYPDFADLHFAGPMSLKRLFQALCKRRGIPSYRADDVLSVAGATIMMGGVAEVDDGDIVIPRTISPLQWLTQKAELFGYRVYDTPIGRVVMSRVSGLPGSTAAARYAEGENAYRFGRRTDTGPMVTYWEVFGAKYTDPDGRIVAIRSIPDSVQYSPELDPPGYRRDSKRDGSLVTLDLAAAVRNVLEVNAAAPAEITTWEVDGAPDRQPGDVVEVASATCAASGNRWLMSIDQSVDDQTGYYATMTGWAGAGSALPAGDDCLTTAVGSETYHVGDSTISWFEDPSPDGTFLNPDDPVRTVVISFTVPDDYSSLTIEGAIHGSNQHFAADEVNDDSTASMFEIWQLPDPSIPADDDNKLRKVGDGQLPILEDTAGANYAGDYSLWGQCVIPITGSLKAGDAELHLTSGYDADTGAYDDYEIKNMSLITCGVGQPDLPLEEFG